MTDDAHRDAHARLRAAARRARGGGRSTLCGWVARRRDHGGVTFIDLRDREGVVQLVFHPEDAPEAHAAAQELRSEDVVRVQGAVRAAARGHGEPDARHRRGRDRRRRRSRCSRVPRRRRSRSRTGSRSSEDLRLKYRYLDLRRPEMTKVLRLRAPRQPADPRAHGRARVPRGRDPDADPQHARGRARLPGALAAAARAASTRLPQSPQQLKQLLMVAGQDRYYQIVRCLRDEDPRADRGFEFTQLDVEMSFVDEEDLIALIEPLFARIVRETRRRRGRHAVPRMTYDEMMERYGIRQARPAVRDGARRPRRRCSPGPASRRSRRSPPAAA